ILGCIDGSIMSNSSYKTAFSTDGANIRIQLQPKAKNLKEFIQQIDVEFAKSNTVLKTVTLTDPSGDKTEIVFSNVVSNQKVDESVFTDF
ncbi:outer membrane lipoprotein carrier protein LolA, partial [Flavobacteriales bacterium]|nr:outer membrane lipoprotein carrier protein LolA [Flavobacteriales bacterium]